MAQEEKLEEAKRLYKTANADQRYVLESLFPELAESEDERIRKAIKYCIKQGFIGCGKIENVTPDECLAWLEKQGNKTEEYIFRPIAGSTIDNAARQAINKATNGENIVFSFNGFFMKIYKDTTIDNIINSYNDFCKKQCKPKRSEKQQ